MGTPSSEGIVVYSTVFEVDFPPSQSLSDNLTRCRNDTISLLVTDLGVHNVIHRVSEWTKELVIYANKYYYIWCSTSNISI
jgi:hypothetical protein